MSAAQPTRSLSAISADLVRVASKLGEVALTMTIPSIEIRIAWTACDDAIADIQRPALSGDVGSNGTFAGRLDLVASAQAAQRWLRVAHNTHVETTYHEAVLEAVAALRAAGAHAALYEVVE